MSRRSVAIVLMIIGAIFLFVPLILWLDSLTTQQPIGIGTIILGLLGAGIELTGLFINKKEKGKNVTTTNINLDNSQKSSDEGRNMQFGEKSTYIENLISMNEGKKKGDIVLEKGQQYILETLLSHADRGYPRDLLRMKYGALFGKAVFENFIERLLRINYIRTDGTSFYLDIDGVEYLYRMKGENLDKRISGKED